METAIIIVSITIFFVIGCIASFRGLDLRKWSSWFYGAISFLCGVALGFIISGDFNESLKAGGIFSFLVLSGGPIMRWHKQRYERK